MLKPLLRLSPLFLVVAFTACIKVDMKEVIDAKGVAVTEIVYDFSGMEEMAQGFEELDMESSSSSGADTEEFNCAQITKKVPKKNVKDVQCVDKAPNIVALTITHTVRAPYFIKRRIGEKTMYLYRLSATQKFLSEGDDSASTSQMDAASTELIDSIFQASLTVTMPGKIVRSPVGKVKGNTVTITSADFQKIRPRSFIQSEGK